MDDPERWLWLARAPGLHAGQLQEWLAQGASPIDLTRESHAALAAIGLGQSAIRSLQQPDSATIASDLRWLQAATNRRLVTWGSAEYPPLLAQQSVASPGHRVVDRPWNGEDFAALVGGQAGCDQ